MGCNIVSVPRGTVYQGRVMAIGHSGLNQSGAPSPDEETALDQLVVKFDRRSPLWPASRARETPR
jgi:hypothetical protein